MKRLYCTVAAVALGMGTAPAALAASDYLLVIEGVEGEASSNVEILSWSWGASNPSSAVASTDQVVSPRDVATGQASGKRQHKPIRSTVTASQNTQSLRESPTKASTGGTQSKSTAPKASWDLATNKGARTASPSDSDCVDTCDSTTGGDLAAVARQDEITGFSITIDKASPVLARYCAQGQHIKDAKITRQSQIVYELQDVVVSGCPATGEPAAGGGSGGGAGKVSVSDLSVMKQTQGASFGERCSSGQCVQADGVALTITGSMKHTKTGHVTLLK